MRDNKLAMNRCERAHILHILRGGVNEFPCHAHSMRVRAQTFELRLHAIAAFAMLTFPTGSHRRSSHASKEQVDSRGSRA
ncbi:MAG TPA: hypothetical protein VLC97_16630, partial [Rhodanobacteraceae bacterium]|nr:hypothetical protein [Rhodanobacteraceae bacterium]